MQDIILDPETRIAIEEMIAKQEIPNIIFSGSPGTGKTTLAYMLTKHLSCDCLELNSSMDRGIDTIRERVAQFVAVRGTKQWRIVLFEEFERMTAEAQDSLKNFIEKNSARCRFIFTSNHPEKITEAILSRCRHIRCVSMPRKECLGRLFKILDAEKVQYDKMTVVKILDKTYPDMRQMLEQLDGAIKDGVLRDVYRVDFDDAANVVALIKAKDVTKLREISYRLDYVNIMGYLFDNIEHVVSDKNSVPMAQITIAEYLHREAMTPDKSINFMALAISLMHGQYKVG